MTVGPAEPRFPSINSATQDQVQHIVEIVIPSVDAAGQACLTSAPLRQTLCFETLRPRQIVLLPCGSRTSASHSIPIICSGVYRFRLIFSSF
jgi:hypothetical protein